MLGAAAAAVDIAERHGLFPSQGKQTYGSSAVYDNPLVGLAFLSLLDPEKDRCPSGNSIASLGIVREAGAGKLVAPANRDHEKRE